MTLTGTNSYLVAGDGEAICVDPGPPIARHVEALVAAADAMQCRITVIALTHGHPDHAPAAQLLRERTGAIVAAHTKCAFPYDRGLRDGERIEAAGVHLDAIDSPGHTFDHLAYFEPREGALFTGDAVLGEGYVVIAPPNGAMRPYQQTLRRLSEIAGVRTIYGGHGEPVTDPQSKLREYLAHRRTREAELLAALGDRAQTIPELVARIYRDTKPLLWPAAARQMLAYLIALEDEGRVTSEDVERDLLAEEHAILNPEWRTIVGDDQAQVIEEELGSMLRLERVRRYRRTDVSYS